MCSSKCDIAFITTSLLLSAEACNKRLHVQRRNDEKLSGPVGGGGYILCTLLVIDTDKVMNYIQLFILYLFGKSTILIMASVM